MTHYDHTWTDGPVNDAPTVPHDHDVEQALIAGALFGETTRGYLLDEASIQPSEFYGLAHRVLWTAIQHVDRAGDPVDVATVVDAARRNPDWADGPAVDLDDIRGAAHTAIVAATDLPSLHRHAAILRDLADRRSLLDACWKTIADLQRPDADGPTVRSTAQARFSAAAHAAADEQTTTVKDAILRAIPTWETPATFRGLSSGFKGADDLLKGLRAGQLIIVGARPAMGKSALALDICRDVAMRQNKRVLLISLEMNEEEIAGRFVAAHASIPQQQITLGELKDFDKVFAVSDTPQTRNLILNDRRDLSVADVEAIARHEHRRDQHGLSLIVIDYLQLLRPTRPNPNRNTEVSEMSRALKVLAGTIGCPVIALSQLKRTEGARKPRLDDLRDSGSLEQDANTVLFLHRDDYYDSKAAPGLADLIVAKNRSGATGDVRLMLEATFPRFVAAPGMPGAYPSAGRATSAGPGPVPLPETYR